MALHSDRGLISPGPYGMPHPLTTGRDCRSSSAGARTPGRRIADSAGSIFALGAERGAESEYDEHQDQRPACSAAAPAVAGMRPSSAFWSLDGDKH